MPALLRLLLLARSERGPVVIVVLGLTLKHWTNVRSVGALLNNVGQLVCNKVVTPRGMRRMLSLAEHNVLSDRERLRPHGRGSCFG